MHCGDLNTHRNGKFFFKATTLQMAHLIWKYHRVQNCGTIFKGYILLFGVPWISANNILVVYLTFVNIKNLYILNLIWKLQPREMSFCWFKKERNWRYFELIFRSDSSGCENFSLGDIEVEGKRNFSSLDEWPPTNTILRETILIWTFS